MSTIEADAERQRFLARKPRKEGEEDEEEDDQENKAGMSNGV